MTANSAFVTVFENVMQVAASNQNMTVYAELLYHERHW